MQKVLGDEFNKPRMALHLGELKFLNSRTIIAFYLQDFSNLGVL